MASSVWIARLGLVLGGLLVGILLADCGARMIQPHGAADLLFNAPDNAPDGMYVTDRDLIYMPHPGFEGTMKSLGYRVPLRFDRHGLRGAEPGPKDRERWLLTGDSFTMAAQVTEAQHFGAHLSEAEGVEALVGGADGWSTWQALRFYRRLDPQLDLDGVVVVFFLGNDHMDNQRFPGEARRAQSRPHGNPMSGRHIDLYTRLLLRYSYLYGLYVVHYRVAQMAEEGNSEADRWRRELVPFTRRGIQGRERNQRDSRSALREFDSTVNERRDRLIVAVAPPAFVVDQDRMAATFELVGLDPEEADLNGPSDALMGLLDELGVQGCDLVEPLQAAQAAGGPPLYFTYDGHWTPAGHRVVGEALAACMKER